MYWIVGQWATDSVFVREEMQPDESTRSQEACEAWVKSKLGPGSYSLIRVEPGIVEVGCHGN